MGGRLPKAMIRITNHAHVRGWDRFDLDLQARKAALHRVLQTGSWYLHPDEGDAFLVLGRVGVSWLCAIAKVREREVLVTTVYPMTNTGQLDRFKRHNPQGPLTAGAVAQRYGLG